MEAPDERDDEIGLSSHEIEGNPLQQTQLALAEANRLYLETFGFIFIVCATGKSADDMLAICRARLENSLAAELQIAAQEQRMITELRLKKLLEK